jgi:hypothetical protein
MAGPGGSPVVLTPNDLLSQDIRNGFICRYPSNGKVVFYDDFRNGINQWTDWPWVMPPSSQDWIWSADQGPSGFSLKLPLSPTLTSIDMFHADSVPTDQDSLCSFECSFTSSPNAAYTTITTILGFQRNSKGNSYEAKVVLHGGSTPTLYIISGDGQYILLPNAPILYSDYNLFNYVKLMFYPDQRKYHKLYVNNQEWDLSGYSTTSSKASVDIEWITLRIAATIAAANTGNLFIGHFLYKTNEDLND